MGVNPNIQTTYPAMFTALNSTVQDININGGKLAQITIVNNDSAKACYIQLFNKPANMVFIGITPPTFIYPAPAAVDAIKPTMSVFDVPNGLDFAPSFSIACTSTPTGSDSPGTDASVFILYY